MTCPFLRHSHFCNAYFRRGSNRERLNPGAAIIVPEHLEKLSWTKELKDWSQIFYQFALGVVGLKVLGQL